MQRQRVHTIPRSGGSRDRRAIAALACGVLALGTIAACENDDDPADDLDTEVDVITSDVTVTSVVTQESEVTIGTVLTSEVLVTETSVVTSEVVETPPGVTTED
jgi:hypothetical protein